MAAISTIIMAGGLGTRMRSPLPKVLHELCGLPMLAWVARAAREAGADDVVVVAGPETAEAIARGAARLPRRRAVAGQRHGPRGRVGLAAVPAAAELVVVLSGDTPLIEPETVRRAIAACSDGVGGALVSARLAPPHAYGRVVRDGERVARIVEARDATPDELALDEFNVGLYCFRRDALAAALPRLDAAERAGRALPDRRDRPARGRRAAAPSRSTSRRPRPARASTRWPSSPSARPRCARGILRDAHARRRAHRRSRHDLRRRRRAARAGLPPRAARHAARHAPRSAPAA